MTKHFIRALLGVAMLAVWAGIMVVPASAGDIYVQPPDNSGNLYASQNDTNSGGLGNFATVYDNFTLGSTSSINMVKWTGGYFNPGPPGAITAFDVDFWADSGGAPGASLASTVVAGNANETFLGSDTYSYSLNLGTPFTALAGTQYWLSVEPDMGFPPQWGWATSTGSPGDGTAYQDFIGTGSQPGTDFAFSLSGTTATPEPGSMLLMATFLMALGPIVRKKLW
jgi:hypothetical protein